MHLWFEDRDLGATPEQAGAERHASNVDTDISSIAQGITSGIAKGFGQLGSQVPPHGQPYASSNKPGKPTHRTLYSMMSWNDMHAKHQGTAERHPYAVACVYPAEGCRSTVAVPQLRTWKGRIVPQQPSHTPTVYCDRKRQIPVECTRPAQYLAVAAPTVRTSLSHLTSAYEESVRSESMARPPTKGTAEASTVAALEALPERRMCRTKAAPKFPAAAAADAIAFDACVIAKAHSVGLLPTDSVYCTYVRVHCVYTRIWPNHHCTYA